VEVKLTTASKNRIFFTPKKLWITMDAGTLESVSYDLKTEKLTLVLGMKEQYTPVGYLRISQDVKLPYDQIRGAYQIPLKEKKNTVIILD
jgi:hypothetical protein